ncbi:MAG: hypothetical protein KUG81_05945 [Gammaproteobacteria bacterium]|nr:hypothetical protein [Gammaproteobacteria bacterium]
MKYTFNWNGEHRLTKNGLKEVEQDLLAALNSPHSDNFSPCHPAPASIQISIVDSLFNRLIGNAKCACGSPYLTIEGVAEPSLYFSLKDIT